MDDKDNELLKMNPFEFNQFDDYIACVGENGGTDNESILMGFRSTVELIIKNIKSENGTEDELIYPLVFSIRHCIELAIKIAIEYIREIYDIRHVAFPVEDSKIHIHDIGELSEHLEKLYASDRRVEDLFVLPLKYADDYNFDKKGDVFRYEKDTDGNESLKRLNISQISISVLEAKFARMMDLFKEGLNVLYAIVVEYSVGTYTKNLSRYDIENISKMLPKYREWGKENRLEDCKNSIKKFYVIGSKEFSDVLNIIKANTLFASNIGIYLKVGHLSDNEIENYVEYVKAFYNPNSNAIKSRKAGDGGNKELKAIQERYKRKVELTQNISTEAMRTLFAFGDMMERGDYYCERYEKHFNHLENKDATRDYLMKKIVPINYAKKIIMGMQLCGQLEYLEKLTPAVDEIIMFS